MKDKVPMGKIASFVINYYGQSASLNIKSRPEDCNIVTRDYRGFDNEL